MKRHFLSLLCLLSVILVFCMTAGFSHLAMKAVAEDQNTPVATDSPKSYQEEPIEDDPKPTDPKPTDPPVTDLKPTEAKTTDPKPTDAKTTDPQTTDAKTTDPKATDPQTTDPQTTDPKATEPATTSANEPGTEKDNTTKGTTKSTSGKNKTSTYKNAWNTTRSTKVYMTVPQVENTTVAGSTLSPMDAYFERISGMTYAEPTEVTEQTMVIEEMPEDDNTQLSTPAIVAICLGGIALVTLGLTGAFVIRNKRAGSNDDGIDPDPFNPDYEDPYVHPDPTGSDSGAAQNTPSQVDESGTFTVVSLDDKDYID